VFINLVGNACEAIEKNESVTWSIHHLEAAVNVRVHNGGNPIPADHLDRITKPFFTTKSSGNGLGLAIVQRIVEAHDGRLSIASEETTGTIVEVMIPIAPPNNYR
jgi:signal transduction histidine kinase